MRWDFRRRGCVWQIRNRGACGRIFGDAPCAGYSRDRRAAGNAAGVAGPHCRARHARLQRHVLPAAPLTSFPRTKYGASIPTGRNGLPPRRRWTHDGVQHEIRRTAHGLRSCVAIPAGKNVRACVARLPESVACCQLAAFRRQFVRRIPRWSFSTAAQLTSSTEAEKNLGRRVYASVCILVVSRGLSVG
jgi:hypothetical protein